MLDAHIARVAPIDRDSQAVAKFARFPRVWLDDINPELTSKYYIKKIIEPKTFIVVYGPAGDGKTFFTIDMVLHPASGLPWRGHQVRPCLVVYVSAEAGATIVRRFAAWRDNKLGDAREGRTPLVILTRGPNLLDEVEAAELMADLKSIAEEADLPLGLVVFDTLARSMAGGDENSASDMGRVIAMADRLRNELGAAMLVVHHSGKDPGKGARGSSALFSAADTVISVIDKVATIEKSRDGISGESFPFSLKVVELGQDEDGDPITTCLVDHQVDEFRPTTQARLSDNEKMAMDALRDALGAAGVVLPGTSSIPQGARGVRIDQWRDTYYRRTGENVDRKNGAEVKSFQRARTGLIGKRVVGASAPWVWVW